MTSKIDFIIALPYNNMPTFITRLVKLI